MPVTSCPAPTRRGTSWRPIAPVAPATKTFIIGLLHRDQDGDRTEAPAVTATVRSMRRKRRSHGAEKRVSLGQVDADQRAGHVEPGCAELLAAGGSDQALLDARQQ